MDVTAFLTVLACKDSTHLGTSFHFQIFNLQEDTLRQTYHAKHCQSPLHCQIKKLPLNPVFNEWKDNVESKGMRVNMNKTKVMISGKRQKVRQR